MKKNILSSFAVVSLLLGMHSCEPSDKKVEKAEKEVQQAKAELTEAEKELEIANAEYGIAHKEWEQKLILNSEKITLLSEKIVDVRLETKSKAAETLRLLEEKNNELRARLKKFTIINSEKWKEFEAEFNRDITDLAKQLIEFQSKN